MSRRQLLVHALPGWEPEIGRMLWMLEDVRRVLKLRLKDQTPQQLDAEQFGGHTVGSLLYHIAAVETDWLYTEVLQADWAPEVSALFPLPMAGEDKRLSIITGETLEQHLHRLDTTRRVFLESFAGMDLAEWRRPRHLEPYDVTPEWVVYHLIEHEAQHRGQIFSMLRSGSA